MSPAPQLFRVNAVNRAVLHSAPSAAPAVSTGLRPSVSFAVQKIGQ